MSLSARLLMFLVLLLSLGCTGTPQLAESQVSNKTAPPPCVVTPPNGSQPPTEMLSGAELHGNGKLWTVLPLDGKVLIPTDIVTYHRGLWWKFPWWRAVRGPLTIRGRRLDAAAGPLQADIPAGYGDTGFQASSVTFPSEGCWRITGRAGNSELTVVVQVRIKR